MDFCIQSPVWRLLYSFQAVMLEKTLQSPLDCKETKPVTPKGNQPWLFIGKTDAEVEALVLWPPDAKSQLIGKELDAGQDWGHEKGMTEGEMVGWHQWLNGHEFEQTLGDSERQWGHKESGMTEWLNCMPLIFQCLNSKRKSALFIPTGIEMPCSIYHLYHNQLPNYSDIGTNVLTHCLSLCSSRAESETEACNARKFWAQGAEMKSRRSEPGNERKPVQNYIIQTRNCYNLQGSNQQGFWWAYEMQLRN